MRKRKWKLPELGSRDYVIVVTCRTCDPVEQKHNFTSSGTRLRPEKSRRWSLEKPPWICSLKNASVPYIFPILWQSSSHDGFNCHRVLIKFWSGWLGCKSRQLSIECLSHHPLFPGKVGGSILKVAGFLASCRCHSGLGPPGPNPLVDLEPPSQIWTPPQNIPFS